MMDTWSHGQRDPQGLEELDREQCRDLVASVRVGRLAFCRGDGVPTVLPVNHVVDAWTVAFRTTFGSKLSAALLERPVAFEVDEFDGERRTGWSVLVRGPVQHVSERPVIERLETLGLDVWADGVERPRWVRVEMEELTGRRITGDDEGRVRRRGAR
jgi:uncharacterized protein